MPKIILYANPLGHFKDELDEYWQLLTESSAQTDAQAYEPHCSLTSFIHNPTRSDINLAVQAFNSTQMRSLGNESTPKPSTLILDEDRPVEARFRIECPAWEEFAAEFRDTCARLGLAGVRPKSNLHLSLAYGSGFRHNFHGTEARKRFSGINPSVINWELVLWHRDDGGVWRRLMEH